MTQVAINGAQLECRSIGSGEPLVFVHGSASDFRTWHLQEEYFSKGFRVVSYSRRYHWPNEPIPDGTDYSMTEHVADLHALIESYAGQPVHLVGHSYGAFLCLIVAMREPSLLRSLVLAEPPVITLFVSNTPKPAEILRLLATRPRTAIAIIKFGTRGVAPATKAFRHEDMQSGIRVFADAVFGPSGYDQLSEKRRRQVHENLSNVKAEILGSGFLSLDARAVSRVQVPTLLLTGAESIRLFHLLTDRLEELLPQTSRAQIPRASHLMHEDNSVAYNQIVHDFLQEKRGAT